MAQDVRAKVRFLIERAIHASTPENEARNAAMAACKLIAEHKMLDAPPPRRVPAPTHVSSSNPFEDLFRAVQDMGGEGFFVNFQTAPEPPRPAPRKSRPAPTPPQPSVENVRRKPKRDPGARQIPITDQAAFCASCGQRILRGKYAMWTPGGTVYHPPCYDAVTEP